MMYETQGDFLESIAKDAVAKTINEAVKYFFDNKYGYDARNQAEKLLTEEVREMLKTDSELRALLRARLIKLIDPSAIATSAREGE